MITTYKNFSIFKGKGDNTDPKTPSHNVSMKVGESYAIVGAMWTKENQYGKFLSGKLQDAWVDHTNNSKTRKGFVIVAEDELNALIKELKSLKGEVENVPELDVINDNIPF